MDDNTRTTVVNIHRREAYDVYIGRAGKGQDGYLGNPFRLEPGMSREVVLERYKEYFLERLEKDSEFKARVLELKGKRLGCFCCPALCHGMVIVEYLDGVSVADQLKAYKESAAKASLPQCFEDGRN